MPPRRAADVLHDLFCRFLHQPGFLSHLRSLKGYDEPEILPSSTRRICLIGADPGHLGDRFQAAKSFIPPRQKKECNAAHLQRWSGFAPPRWAGFTPPLTILTFG